MSFKLATLKRNIETKEELHYYLHIAMELELSTIPAYMSGIYSITPDSNQAAIDVMHSVLIEEMFHLTMAGNILKATGGTTKISDREFVPTYPTPLPKSDIDSPDGSTFMVPIQKFSREAVKETFMGIEQPEKPLDKDDPTVEGYHSIGQFYDGLAQGIDDLCGKLGTAEVFNGSLDKQIRPEDYYGGSGHFVVVADKNPEQARKNAHRAIEEIVEQGEGVEKKDGDESVFDCDFIPGRGHQEIPVPAHYYRFDEINQGLYYQVGDKPHEPTGDALHVDWDAVYDMEENPMMTDYEEGSEIYEALLDFNRTYMRLLNALDLAFNVDRSQMMKSVGVMYDLKYKAIELMKIPNGKDDGKKVGPSFEYIAPGI
jgi:hypothetical protein